MWITNHFDMMKHLIQRGGLLTLVVFGMLFRMSAQSTQLIVTLNDGTEQSYMMTEDDRLYFEDNEKLVIERESDKETTKIPLADIRKLTCSELEGAEENTVAAVAVFPNPVHDVLTLRNLSGKQTVSIYAIDGRLVKSFETDGSQPIDVGGLPFGLYLVKTQSATLKMIKL